MKTIVILGILVVGTSVWGSERITIRRERTPEREYYQYKDGKIEKVKEYGNGTTVKEGFRYESGKGIVKYNEPVPKEKSRGK